MADPNEILFRTQKNEADAVQALIDGGVDASYANGVGQTALHVACLWGNIDVAKVLVKAGAQVNAINNFSGAAPLHCAATENERGNKEGRNECIKLLVEAGADVNLRDMRGKKAQQYAVSGSGVRTMLGVPEEPGPDEEAEEEEEDDEPEMLPDSEKTPVTLVTGFLGTPHTMNAALAGSRKPESCTP
ncbi:ankyrin repeat-containing domain protein [Baffinella frigidus]|nr:ankyrin repeat-containing domain protein [Cryptophyta sp. CCMP2293]